MPLTKGAGGGSADLFDMFKVSCSNPSLTTSRGLQITPGVFKVYSWKLQWTTELASFSKVSQTHRINVNIVNPMECLVHCVINFLQNYKQTTKKMSQKPSKLLQSKRKTSYPPLPNNKHTLWFMRTPRGRELIKLLHSLISCCFFFQL